MNNIKKRIWLAAYLLCFAFSQNIQAVWRGRHGGGWGPFVGGAVVGGVLASASAPRRTVHVHHHDGRRRSEYNRYAVREIRNLYEKKSRLEHNSVSGSNNRAIDEIELRIEELEAQIY